MNFLILISVFTLVYYRLLPSNLWALHGYDTYARWLDRSMNDGHTLHGAIAWGIGVLLPTLLLTAAYIILMQTSWPLAALLGVVIVYLLLDIRSFETMAEAIADDLKNNNLSGAQARTSLTTGIDADAFGASEVSCVTIEQTLTRAHSEIFAPVFWFILLGPGGALLYRLSQRTQQAWNDKESDFTRVAQRTLYWLDWLPARLTAISYAVVGDFEDALFCWRTQATQWKDEASGIILASAAGALGVRLGDPLTLNNQIESRTELGLGDSADADYIISTIALIWRALVLILILVLLMTIASWLGS